MRRGLHPLSPKQSRNPVEETAVPGDEPITEFAREGEARNLLIEPQWPRLSHTVSHQPENGFAAVCVFPIRLDEPHGAFEFLSGDFGISPAGFLRRCISNAIACKLPPIFDPDRAKAASAVVNEDRAHTNVRSIRGILLMTENTKTHRHKATKKGRIITFKSGLSLWLCACVSLCSVRVSCA